jgi:hypothetical protein
LPVVVIEAGPDEAGRVEIEETYTYGSSVRLEFTTDVLTGQTNVVAGVVSTDDGSEPVGTVTFTATNKDTGQVRPLGSPAVGAGGMASVSVALPAGRYRIDAVFTPAAGSTVTGSRASTDDPGMSDYLVRQAGVTLVVDQPPTVLMARQPVTVGAALVPELGAVGEMSGWVQFSVDGSPVGGPVRVTGQRVEIVTRLSAGTHQVTASYTGDECFSSAVSSAVEWVVSQAPTTTVLRVWRPSADTTDLMVADVSVNAPAWADVAPSGSVSIYDSATSLLVAGPVLVDATGMARLSLTLAQGNHPLFAVYGGDDDFRVSSSDVVVAVVDGQATAVNVQADPSPAHRGDTVRITAQVSGVPGGALTGRTPTGTVKFAIDGVGRGPDQTLDAEGRATLMVDGLGVGTHTVTVSYLGGGGFAKSAGTYALRVLQSETGRPTRAELVTWASHPDTSGVVPVDIVVTGPSGEDRVPDGTVTVFDGSGDRKVAGPIALDPNGRARASLELARGQHFLYAVYSGSLGFAGSTTQVVLVDVAGRPTLSELKVWTSSPDTSDAVLVDVTVINPSGDSLVPDGAVEVFDASGERQVAGPVRLDPDGRARAALILAGGRHLLYAVYTGGDRFDGSTTQVVPVDVAGRATTLTLGASGSPVVRGDPVLVSALVAEAVGGTLPGSALTGSVQFAVDGLGIGAISAVDGSGVARFVSEALPVGTHTISAEYLGDQSHAASKATVEVVVVAPPRVAAVSLSATKKKDSVSGRVHVTVSSVALQDGYRLGHRKVEFFVNGKRVGSVRTDVKGQASYTIPHAKLKLGKNPILVRHNAGSSAFQPTVAATLSVTVQRLRPVSLKIKPEWHPRSREVVVTVKANTLVDGYKHNGRLVTATARGTSVATARTNRNGVAVLVIPIRDLKVGVNPLKVIFNSGSGRYRPVFSTTWLIERLPNGTATITKASKP